MNAIKPQEVLSNYSGSQKTYENVANQIRERWGEKEVKNYDPYTNCLTFRQWSSLGYKVKKGEVSIKSITLTEEKNATGEVIKKHPRIVHLFYRKQVSKA